MDNPMFWLGLITLVITILTALGAAGVFLWKVASKSTAASVSLDNSVQGLNKAVNGLLDFQRETHEFKRETHERLKLLEAEAAERRKQGNAGT